MVNRSIYERLVKSGIPKDSALKFATAPKDSKHYFWGIRYENGWPDVSVFIGNMTWEQAYNKVLDLRAVIEVHNS